MKIIEQNSLNLGADFFVFYTDSLPVEKSISDVINWLNAHENLSSCCYT